MELNFNLQAKNTLNVQAIAEKYAAFHSLDELANLLAKKSPNEPLLILGGGSNVLFVNEVKGWVLENKLMGKSLVKESDTHVWVEVQAGENWHEFVLWAIENNWGGIENLSLIPGKVGASPMQNIGAYGVEVKDVITEVRAWNIKEAKLETFSNAACAFGYRESIFKNEKKGQYVITSVVFKLSKPPHTLHTTYGAITSELEKMQITNPTIADVSKAVINIRSSKLPNPTEIPNAGSFFKNPIVDLAILEELQNKYPQIPFYAWNEYQVKIPAGWLIEKSGWKGKSKGKVGVHAHQALVLINPNNGTGKEIYDLSEKIKQDVISQFGIELVREVNVI